MTKMTATDNTIARMKRLLSMLEYELTVPGHIHPAEKDDTAECAEWPTIHLSAPHIFRSPRMHTVNTLDNSGMQA
jgi:hypothetical protein